MKFEEAVEIVLEFEKGYVFHKDDPGGETNFGISRRSHPTEDIKNMTKERAKEIYRSAYWEKARCEDIPLPLRLSYFDCAVNQGVGAAVKLLQRSVGVKDDMIFGQTTLLAVRKSGKELLLKFLVERALHYVRALNFSAFGRGWFTRLMHVALLSGKNW